MGSSTSSTRHDPRHQATDGGPVVSPATTLRRRHTLLGVLNLVGVLLVYFALPLDWGAGPSKVLLGLVASLVGLVLVVVVVGRELLRIARGDDRGLHGFRLLILLELVLVLFAFGYYSMAEFGTGQMAGLRTRVDALYFSTVTMTTVGYGDVYAAGQLARVIVTAQLLFDAAFIAIFARLISASVSQARGSRHPHDEREPDVSSPRHADRGSARD